MIYELNMILSVVPAGLIVWVPVLIIIGYLLKHGTSFPNGFITLMLFAISAAVSAAYGFFDTEGMAAPMRALEVILAYGLGYGLLLAMLATFLYDSVHGAVKHIRGRNGRSEEAGAGCAAASAKEMKMAETATASVTVAEGTAEKKRKFRMTSFLTYLLVVIGSVALGTLMALPWGIGPALDFVSKALVLAVIMCGAADAAFKIRFEKWKLMWQYWIGIVLVIGADWCFLWASMTTTWGMMGIALGVTAGLGIGAGAWFWLAYKKKVDERKAAYIAEYEQALISKGVDAGTAAEVAAAAKEEA